MCFVHLVQGSDFLLSLTLCDRYSDTYLAPLVGDLVLAVPGLHLWAAGIYDNSNSDVPPALNHYLLVFLFSFYVTGTWTLIPKEN